MKLLAFAAAAASAVAVVVVAGLAPSRKVEDKLSWADSAEVVAVAEPASCTFAEKKIRLSVVDFLNVRQAEQRSLEENRFGVGNIHKKRHVRKGRAKYDTRV